MGLQEGADANSPRPLLGNLLIFLSALSWAVYTIQGRVMAEKSSALVMTAASIGAATLQMLPFAIWETFQRGLPELNSMAWLGIVNLGNRVNRVTTILWNEALHYLPAASFAFVNLSSVIGWPALLCWARNRR